MLSTTIFLLLMTFQFLPPHKDVASFEPIAVMELFTSQGCSSCPPADELLSQNILKAEQEGKNIYALSFHVDYWNRLGWSDPFSDKKYSDRQSSYAAVLNPGSVYTPQLIVNGRREFVGSDKSSLATALAVALKKPAIAGFKKLVISLPDGKSPHVHFELEGEFAQSDVRLALVALKEITSVQRGENGGQTLTNEYVVRQFIAVKAAAIGEAIFAPFPVPAAGNRTIIAFIQRKDDLEIIGASSAAF